MEPLVQIVQKQLQIYLNQLPRLRVVVGVSGGMDSMALLEALTRLLRTDQICVAHFHHNVREFSSERDFRFVRSYARARGLAFFSALRQGRKTSEAALREERRSFLERIQRKTGSEVILVAHHAQDQLETLLMRLLRGSGLTGLSGISPFSSPWLRPLLPIPKSEIESFVRTNKICFLHDETNDQEVYFRNRVRKNLIPVVESLSSEFGGATAFYRRLTGTLDEVRQVNAYLSNERRLRLDSMCVRTAFWTRISYSEFKSLDNIWRWQFYREVLGSQFSRRELNELDQQITKRSKGFDVSGKVHVSYSLGFLFFQTLDQRKRLLQPRTVTTCGNRALYPELDVELIHHTGLSSLAEFRVFRPGDRYRGEKMKRLFWEQKIPRWERALIPLLAKSESSEVLWYLGEENSQIHIHTATFPFSFMTRPAMTK